MTDNTVSDALRALARGTAPEEVREVLDRRDTWGGRAAGSLVADSEAQHGTDLRTPGEAVSDALRVLAGRSVEDEAPDPLANLTPEQRASVEARVQEYRDDLARQEAARIAAGPSRARSRFAGRPGYL